MEVPKPLALPHIEFNQAIAGAEVVVSHFYADSYPGKRGTVISAFEVNGKQRVKVHLGTNRAGKKFIKQFPLNVIALVKSEEE